MEKLKSKYLEKANKIHDGKYRYISIVKPDTILEIECPIHGAFFQKYYNHIYRRNGCSKCNKKGHSKLEFNDFVTRGSKIHKYKYKYFNYINMSTKIDILCPVHGIFKTTPHTHILLKTGCPKCANNINFTNGQYIAVAKTIHDCDYDYSQTAYIRGSEKVKIICKKHGLFEQEANSHLQGRGCPKCSSSKGEKLIRNILEKNNIKFIEQKTFNNCRNPITNKLLIFDFYLQELNIIIEYDGIQHSRPVDHFGGVVQFKKQQLNDLMKDQYCDINNISMIRYNYNDHIIKNF